MFATWLCGLSWLAIGAEAPDPERYPAGSLIVLENCNSVVEGWTQSSVGHVALIFPEDDQLCIFEATPGCVRKVTLAAYLAELAELNRRRKRDIRAKVYLPQEPYLQEEITAMRCYLESQIGRRYSISSFGRNRAGDGIHCAELAANTLNRSDRFSITQCHQETPGTLTEKLPAQYKAGVNFAIPTSLDNGSWCTRSWQRWTGYGQWCQWSCGEAWSWCW